MLFQTLPIHGSVLITLEKIHDQRGSFARIFCSEEFTNQGIHSNFKQDSLSWNVQKGTIRGMHYQEPYPEIKIVQCIKGAIFDVIIDLRQDSPSFEKHVSVELSEYSNTLLYIPAGCVHGFQTLQDDTILLYKISEPFRANCAQGILWNDPYFSIKWPLPVTCISEKDTLYAHYASTNY